MRGKAADALSCEAHGRLMVASQCAESLEVRNGFTPPKHSESEGGSSRTESRRMKYVELMR